MKSGNYNIHIINSGMFKLDGGAMFGIIPKPLWEKSNPADALNRISLATRNLLLIKDKRKILVDTGMGNKWSEKARQIYDMPENDNLLEIELKKININAGDITDVILTHLHFDHTGGSTKMENGKLIPSFPNAKYYVQKKNFEWAMNPTERDRGSYLKENFLPIYEAGVLNFIDGEEQFDDEIGFIVINGHTFSQQLIKISDSSNTFLYCCDLFPTTAHIPVPYVMGYDLQPLITVEEKKKILKNGVEEEWRLIFEHDPDTVCSTVSLTQKGYIVKEKYNEL